MRPGLAPSISVSCRMSQPVIDIHTHPVHRSDAAEPEKVARLVAESRQLGIVRMNALGDVCRFGITPNGAQLETINDESGALRALFPDFFTCFVHLNPTLGERAVMREVERCVHRYGCRGIKLEKANNAAAACMRHVAKAAREFDLIVLQHTWTTLSGVRGRIPRRHQSDPIDTAAFARRYPDVKVLMAHLTGFGFRGVLEVKNLPNVLIDTSAGYPEEGLIEYAVEHLGADRVVYGSDLPIRESSVTIGRILGARISAAARRKILYTNAARLLGLD